MPQIGSGAAAWRIGVVDSTSYSSVVGLRIRVDPPNGAVVHDIAFADITMGERKLPGSGQDDRLVTTVKRLGPPILDAQFSRLVGRPPVSVP